MPHPPTLSFHIYGKIQFTLILAWVVATREVVPERGWSMSATCESFPRRRSSFHDKIPEEKKQRLFTNFSWKKWITRVDENLLNLPAPFLACKRLIPDKLKVPDLSCSGRRKDWAGYWKKNHFYRILFELNFTSYDHVCWINWIRTWL